MIRKEFRKWIIDDIKDRLSDYNYPPMTEAMFKDLSDVMDQHTDDEYDVVSENLTYPIAEALMKHGIRTDHAIRMSWKWSD